MGGDGVHAPATQSVLGEFSPRDGEYVLSCVARVERA
jgi:hypothetical protein